MSRSWGWMPDETAVPVPRPTCEPTTASIFHADLNLCWDVGVPCPLVPSPSKLPPLRRRKGSNTRQERLGDARALALPDPRGVVSMQVLVELKKAVARREYGYARSLWDEFQHLQKR